MAVRATIALMLLAVALGAGCGGTDRAVSPSTRLSAPRPAAAATQGSPPATAASATVNQPSCPGGFARFHTAAGWTRVRVSTITLDDGCRSWLHLTNPSGATATAPIGGTPGAGTISPHAAILVGVTELSGEPVIVVVAWQGASNDFPELFTVVNGNLRAISVPVPVTWGGTVEDMSALECNRVGALVQSDAGWETSNRWSISRHWLVLSGQRLELVGQRQATYRPTGHTEGVDLPGAEWHQAPFATCRHLSRFERYPY